MACLDRVETRLKDFYRTWICSEDFSFICYPMRKNFFSPLFSFLDTFFLRGTLRFYSNHRRSPAIYFFLFYPLALPLIALETIIGITTCRPDRGGNYCFNRTRRVVESNWNVIIGSRLETIKRRPRREEKKSGTSQSSEECALCEWSCSGLSVKSAEKFSRQRKWNWGASGASRFTEKLNSKLLEVLN